METRNSTNTRALGFTLVELLVVIAIIALLLSIVVPGISLGINKAKVITCKSQLKSFHTALFAYGTDEDLPGTFPRFGGTTVDAPHEGRMSSFRVLYPSNPVLAVRDRGGYLTNPDGFFCPLVEIDVDTYFNPEPNWVQTTYWGSYVYYYRHIPGSLEVPLRPGNDPTNPSGANRNDMTSVGPGSEDTMMVDSRASYFTDKGFRVKYEHYNVLSGDGGVTSFVSFQDFAAFVDTKK